MDEIKWSKNETNNSSFNKTYIDTLTNGQKFLIDDLSRNCYDKDNIKVCLNEQDKFILPDSKTSNDSNEKLNIGGLDRQAQIQQIVENTISEESRIRIHQILEMVSALTSAEKLLLYLRLPTDSQPIADPLRQPLNPLGSRTEISQTINWIRTHLEEDPQLAMQKQDVYEEYLAYCSENEMKALSTADFGKVMKQVYPRVRPRRLGTRGHSKYCYAGLRKRVKLEPPVLPDLLDFPKSTEIPCSQADLMKAASHLIREWAENLLGMQFPTLEALACHLINIKCVDTRSVAALTVINVFGRNIDKVAKLKDPTIGKHRETQLQLQRKLHQREVIREQKRKLQLQTPKCDTNSSAKRTRKVKTEQNTPSTSPLLTDEADHRHVDILNKGAETQNLMNTLNNDNNSPQTIAQGNKNVSGPLRVIPVCDKKTSTIQSTTLPDFSSFQVNTNNNNNNNNYSQNINYNTSDSVGSSTTTTQTKHEKIVDQSIKKLKSLANKTTNNNNNNSKSNKEKISVKSFANKSISRSNSCENDATVITQSVVQDNSPSTKLTAPQLPNLILKTKQSAVSSSHIVTSAASVFSQKPTKYKAIPNRKQLLDDSGPGRIASSINSSDPNTIRSHDNNVVQVDSTSRDSTSTYALGYYNPIVENSDNKPCVSTVLDAKSKTSRERVYSIGNIDKDALDDYLYSGNNSQEPEEEIMQYFQNDSSSVEDFSHSHETKINLNPLSIEKSELKLITNEDHAEKCDKISQLRLLLEKNIPNSSISKPPTDEIGSIVSNTTNNNYQIYQPANLETHNSLILSSLLTSTSGLNTKRRVSFDTQNNGDSIPPSPNTRRKIFSFTPISPGPNSPGTSGGKQSKNSSTNASPFVSPRNTPVPTKFHTRNRLSQPSCSISTTTSNAVIRQKKICGKPGENGDVKLTIDIEKVSGGQFVNPNENQNLFSNRKSNLPMSAPPSPMLSSYRQKPINPSNYLKTLLDTDVPPTKIYTSNDSTNIDEYIDKKLQSKSTNSKHNLTKLKIDINPVEHSVIKSSDNSPSYVHTVKCNENGSTACTTNLQVHSADPLSQEVSQFFPDDAPVYNTNDNMENLLFRSQSVPLHQMKSLEDNLASPNSVTATPQYFSHQPAPYNFTATSNVTSTCSSVGQTPVPNEFSDFTGSFGDNAIINENLDKIINIWQNDSNNMQINSDLLVTNDTEINVLSNFDNPCNDLLTSTTNNASDTNELIQQLVPPDSSSVLMRSQSIDFSGVINQDVKYPSANYPPSRSVPSTPLPYTKEREYSFVRTDTYETSKSHPSTPLINETGFTYNKTIPISDYLLNGQPINSKKTNYLTTAATKSNDLVGTNFINKATTAKENLLSDTYVDDSFSFSDSVLIDTNETFSHFSRDTQPSCVVADNEFGIQLTTTTTSVDTSENFVTSTNDQQNLT